MKLLTHLLSEKQLKNLSVLDIKNTDDLHALELGTTNNTTTCPTCNKKKDCNGHIGIIWLNQYIIHPLFEMVLKNIINTHCHHCGRKKNKNKCSSCHFKSRSNYKYHERSYNTLVSEDDVLTYDGIIKILNNISPDLKNMFIRFIVVPPNRFRISLPEYPDSTELSKSYVLLLRSIKSTDNVKIYNLVKNIIGPQSNATLYQMISGKNGLFRESAFGKRINKSGRSTICCDPYLPIDYIGVPRIIAEDFKIQVNITFHNYNTFKDMVLYDRNKNMITTIVPGMEAYRDCQDGDMVCLNRQPSLSKYSILSFKIKIHDKGNVIYINPCITSSFNADFDGDEMNLFLLDDMDGYEMDNILYVGNNTKYIKPIQDTVIGVYLMSQCDITNNNTIIDDVVLLSCYPINKKHIDHCKDSSKGLLSLCFPETLCYNKNSVIIENGILMSGIINKSVLYDILSYCDILKVAYLLQIVAGRWLMTYGLTITASDCQMRTGYQETITLYKDKIFEDEEDAKLQIDNLRRMVESNISCDNNNLYNIIKSGSKGNILNFMQISLYVGQQYVNGDRINNSGFCSNSFFEGLDSKEFFYHQMAAREGIVNTGVSTSETGYLNRRVAKFASDIIYDTYGNIVDKDIIIQFK